MLGRRMRFGFVVLGYGLFGCGGAQGDAGDEAVSSEPDGPQLPSVGPAGGATASPAQSTPSAGPVASNPESANAEPAAPVAAADPPASTMPSAEDPVPAETPAPDVPPVAEQPTDPVEEPMGTEEMPGPDVVDGPEPGAELVTDAAAFTIAQQLASDVEPAAPTTVGIVTWSTTLAEVTDAYVEFGLDENYGMVAPVDLAEPEYRTLLLGMKPEQDYHYRIVAASSAGSTASADQVITTGAPTSAVRIGTFSVIDDAARQPGFIVGSYWQGDDQSVGFIVDSDGEIVWWHDFGGGGIARMRMSATGKNMWMISASNTGAALQRVGLDGMGGETYANTTGSHDLTAVSGETMAYLDYGESDCDSIFEVDPAGVPVEIWDSEEEFGGASGGIGGGGCHGNALRYSATEDVYTFSDVSQGFAIVSRAGELQWRLSDIVPGGNADWGGRNHGHQLLDDSMLIYANDGGQASSAAIEYSLDGERIFFYDSGDGTANLGDVQRLPGGNTLVTHSNDSIVHEVDPDGNVVMEFDGAGARIGYTLWRASLYGAPPDLGL